MTKYIDQMYAFVVVDPEDDTEGITAFVDGGGMAMPMVGADMDRVDSLRPIAEGMAKNIGRSISVLRFSQRTEIEVIKP